jgi:hypothetical protein
MQCLTSMVEFKKFNRFKYKSLLGPKHDSGARFKKKTKRRIQ